MSFSNSKNPSEWQTAYTRDKAFRDSLVYARSFIIPLVLCAFFAIAYCLAWAARLFLVDPPTVTKAALALLVFLLPLLILFPVMLIAAFRTARSFFSAFYSPPPTIDPGKIIQYRLFGKIKLPAPLNMLSQFKYILIRDADIDKKDLWPAWAARNVGGPVMLIVFDGCALYLERGNQFSRIVGPGDKTPFLEWYETIKYVVDLRPQVKTGNFDVWTKDGIKITISAQIECRIGNPDNTPPGVDLIYPYDPVAVKKAIERYALRWPNRLEGTPEEFTWIDAAWGQVTGIIPGYIGSRLLDDLFLAERESGQILSPDSLKQLLEKLNNATSVFGVYVTHFQILNVKFPDNVYTQQKEYWKAEKKSIATLTDGDTKATNIRVREKVRADAQRHLIQTIANGLEKNKNSQLTESLLLALPGLLDEGVKDPVLRAYLANQKLETWEQIKRISRQSAQEEKQETIDDDIHRAEEEDHVEDDE